MKNLSLENIIAACRGTWCGDNTALHTEITAVTTDSRAAAPGSLFAAIPGEKVDGHDFVASAFENGALCALVQRIPAGAAGNFICVPDTVTALQAIAAFYRAQFDIPILGITGSVGKTTAKEMIAAVLGQRYRVHKTAGNFNNDLGVPLTLFGLDETHEAAIVEMGVSHPGDMARLAEMVRPDGMLYTIIGHAHLEFLKSREGILAEKSAANAYLSTGGMVFCNGDDDLLRAMQCTQRKVTFGLGAQCDVRAENVCSLPDGSTACRVIIADRAFDVTIPAYGGHMVYAALEGAAVGMAFGLSDAEIAVGIADYAPVGSRARLLKAGELTIVDDCYNANPTSTASAIRSLTHSQGRTVCILGDMLELGEDSAALHYETGALAKDCGIDLILTVGQEAENIARGAGERSRNFESKASLLAALPELILPGDTVLVKASHSLHFEEITEALKVIGLKK